MGLIIRVLIGYVIASFVAGLTTVLFAWTPSDLASMQGDIANDKLALAIPAGVIIGLFSCVPALIAIAFGERHRRHDWLYYAIAGIVIALIGFFAQYMSEDARQAWSIAGSNYPLLSFVTSGFLAGLAYWIFAGRFAGMRGAKPGPDLHRKPTPASGSRPNPQRM